MKKQTRHQFRISSRRKIQHQSRSRHTPDLKLSPLKITPLLKKLVYLLNKPLAKNYRFKRKPKQPRISIAKMLPRMSWEKETQLRILRFLNNKNCTSENKMVLKWVLLKQLLNPSEFLRPSISLKAKVQETSNKPDSIFLDREDSQRIKSRIRMALFSLG
jgi:hypothetical protein